MFVWVCLANWQVNSYIPPPKVTPPLATPVTAAVIPITPKTQSTTVYSALNQSLESWIAQSNWPSNLHPTVYRIVMCESSGIVGIATNPPYVGLMQVDPRLHGPVPIDAVGQLNQGYSVYLKQGWSAWGCK